MQERIYKTPAVVLRRLDFGETGKQLIIYTPRYGKLSVIAKGVKRATSKLAGHLEPLALSHVVAARGRNLDTITQADTVESFIRARSEPDRLFHALLVAELLDKLTVERDPNPVLWLLFVDTLRRVDSGDDTWRATVYFWLRLLSESGYQPALDACVQCGSALVPRSLYFGPTAGGLLCQSCRVSDLGAFPVSPNAVKVMRAGLAQPYEEFGRIRVSPELRQEIGSLLRSSTRSLLEVELGSAGLLDELRWPASAHSAS